jgi:hypothetical protein
MRSRPRLKPRESMSAIASRARASSRPVGCGLQVLEIERILWPLIAHRQQLEIYRMTDPSNRQPQSGQNLEAIGITNDLRFDPRRGEQQIDEQTHGTPDRRLEPSRREVPDRLRVVCRVRPRPRHAPVGDGSATRCPSTNLGRRGRALPPPGIGYEVCLRAVRRTRGQLLETPAARSTKALPLVRARPMYSAMASRLRVRKSMRSVMRSRSRSSLASISGVASDEQ